MKEKINTALKASSRDKSRSWQLFNRIAHRYDLINRVLSLGMDIYWRRTLCRQIHQSEGMVFLDVATGTGDLLFSILKRVPQIKKAVGVDLSEEMLKRASAKKHRLAKSPIQFKIDDACRLSDKAQSYDLLTIAFGIRNVPDVAQALKNFLRVLKPGGQVLLLEFSMPQNLFIKMFYLFYLRHILPRIGGLFSGDVDAYQYLNETIETFPYGEKFNILLRQAGFTKVHHRSLTMGVVTLYEGIKQT